MIKIGNHIRFGKHIVVVEGMNNDSFLIRELKSKVINWVKKSVVRESIVPIKFKSQLNESIGTNYIYKNGDLEISIKSFGGGSKITILEEGVEYYKEYPYSTFRTMSEFNKYFNYINELTPYKLEKYGFQKKEV